jgi:hypothetical protein
VKRERKLIAEKGHSFSGYAATREDAMADFKAAWERKP